MQIVSDEVKALLAKHAKITLSAYIDGECVAAGIGSCAYTAICGSSEEFSFGNACAAGITLVLTAAMPDLKDHRINVTWAVAETEYPLFSGKVENAVVSAGRTMVEAWDDMYYGGSDAFMPTAAMYGDIDAADAFSQVAAFMGVEPDQASMEALAGVTIAGGFRNIPEELSNSSVAGHIAGLLGSNALMTRNGQLAVRGYTQSGWTTEPYAGGASANNTDFCITGITLQRDELVTVPNSDGTSGEEEQVQEFFAGDGTLMVNNPLADQAAADRAFATLEGVVIRPGSYSFPGGLLLEPGDIIRVESMDGTYSVAAVTLNMSFDGGVKTTIACGGASEVGGAAGAINQALVALTADFARLRSLVAENASIVSAKITNLRAEDIVAGRIRSTDFATVTLDELYPASDLFPAPALYPNNGEQITRGFEIDFASGVIRGVFYNTATDALERRVESLERRLESIESALA